MQRATEAAGPAALLALGSAVLVLGLGLGLALRLGLRLLRWAEGWRRTLRLAATIPGPPALPLLGNCLQLRGSPAEVFRKAEALFALYGPAMRLWLGPKLYVFVFDPDDVETVLTSAASRDHSPEYAFFVPWLGDGIFCSNGLRWERHRQLVSPAFHYSVLHQFVPAFAENSLTMVRRLRRELGRGPRGFDVFDYISLCTLDILLETAMGVRLNIQRDDNPQFVQATQQMCDIVHQRHYKVWLRSDLLFSLSRLGGVQRRALGVLHSTTRLILSRRRQPGDGRSQPGGSTALEREQELEQERARLQLKLEDEDVGAKRRLSFLDLLLERAGGGHISDSEVKQQVDSLMFGGHETTAATFGYLMMLLAFHPDIQGMPQEAVCRELNDIFGGSARPPVYEDLQRMKLLERCLREAMRLFTIVPIMGRSAAADLPLKSCVAPAGCTLVVVSYLVHRNPAAFPDPLRFDPDRFLPEKMAQRHPFSYLPFSAGARNCIGQKFAMLQMKVTTSTMLRHFRILPVGRQQDVRLVAELVSKPVGGFRICIEPRHTSPAPA